VTGATGATADQVRAAQAKENAAQRPSPFKIRPIGARDDTYFNGLIYGPPGVGKTLLCATAGDVPWMRDVLFIDVDNGTLTASEKEGIDVIPDITRFSTIARIQEFLRIHCRLRDNGEDEKLLELQTRYGLPDDRIRRYQTVVLDTITEAQKLVLYQLTGDVLGALKVDDEPESIQIQQWGQAEKMVQNLVRELRNLPIHVLIVAHERIDTDRDGRPIRRLPALQGKMIPIHVQGLVDVVGYMTPSTIEGKFVRRLYLQGRQNFHAKCRIPGLTADHIDNPSMKDLVASLTGARKT